MTRTQFERYVEWVTQHGVYAYREAGLKQLTFGVGKSDKPQRVVLRWREDANEVILEVTGSATLPDAYTNYEFGYRGFDAVLHFEHALGKRFPYGPTNFHEQMGLELLTV